MTDKVYLNPCGLPTDHPNVGGIPDQYDENVDKVRVLDPYTGTFKPYKSYAIDAKNLDMATINQVRYLLTPANTGLPWAKVLEIKRNVKAWESAYMSGAFPAPKKKRTCSTDINPETLPVEGYNMHELFAAFPPVGFNLAWIPEGFWNHYDESFPKLKEW